MTEKVNTRKFSVSPHIIYSLIKAQAGTLGKGLLECIMNSVDAGATQVDIELKAATMKVTDNGKGFRSRAEIEACFEVFGFEHKEGDRTYGQFGIGRAQLWNFASTVWHTNQFRMDVDIKNRGLDYDLVEHENPVAGLVIEGKFYEPMSTSDILACERELKELAMYVSVPVTFNGTRISKDPADQKWTHETADAWIHLNSSASQLTVYNLGVKVRDYGSWQFGCGGLVVTKPGVRLALNMARNDIVLTECQVWKRIKPFLQKKSDEAVKRSPRLTEDQLANLCVRYLAGEIAYEEISNRKLVVDVLGNKYTLDAFFDKAWRSTDKTVTFAPKEDAGPVNEQAHRSGFCFVLGHQTLTRFGVRTLSELMDKLKDTLKTHTPQLHDRFYHVYSWQHPKDREKLVIVENWRQACKRIVNGYTEVPHKDWTKREQAAMAALSSATARIPGMLHRAGLQEGKGGERELRLGVSEIARAWTDGTAINWLNREELALLDQGMAGAWILVSLLVHEYLHEEASTDTHAHDLDFYKRFHDAMGYVATDWAQLSAGYIAQQVLRFYAKECAKRDVPVKSRVIGSLDAAEQIAVAA